MVTFITKEIMGTTLDITDRYSDLEPRGMGSSGVICSAYDSIRKQIVAIKKIGKPFENETLAKRTYREVHLLSNLRHENLINMTDIFISPAEDLYIVTDCIDTDLHRLIHSRKTPLEGRFTQFFTYQLLRGLKYIHSAGIIHRDLKPGNILINENCDLKICDFGLAREQDYQMTGYVVTRYYRAPEIMLTWQNYTYAVDVWSVGCILAELLSGQILFPGKDYVHQFTLIIELLGKPPKEVMERIYSETTLDYIKQLPDFTPHSLSSRLGNVDPQALDLLEKMLQIDPEKRITVTDALTHPYVLAYQDSEDEPTFPKQLDWSLLDSERSADEWKSTMYFEILDFHRGASEFSDINSPTTSNNLKRRAGEMMEETY